MTDPATPNATGAAKAAPTTTAKLRETIDQGLGTARESASEALATVRGATADVARLAGEGIEGNPLAVLVGGIAVGVLAGALLPKTDRESELLGPVGKKLTEGASTAARAARDAGKAELLAAGISSEAARAQVGKLLDNVLTAAKTAGDAAVKTAKVDK